MTAISLARIGPRTRKRAGAWPIEYNLLLTATLCLLAFGVVMVFSASSTAALLGKSGDSAFYLKRTLVVGAVGLVVMRLLSMRGARVIRPLTPLLVACSFFLLLAVMLPGVGASANGAQRWIAVGPLQVQPSELAKLALVLYGAQLLAARPRMVRTIRTAVPYLAVVGLGCLLMVVEPDLGTAIVVCLATAAIAAVIGEELGLMGISVLIGLYGLFGYAGLRTAQRARDRYGKLLAAGLTSLVLIQAIVNLFAVLGLAPLTGVPLPFVSYGNSSLLVMLAATGLLLNVARDGYAVAPARRRAGAARLRVVDGGRAVSRRKAAARGRSVSSRAKSRHSGRGDRRARRAGAGRRRRASG